MSILQIMAALLIGVSLLTFGITRNKKWAIIVSVIPLLAVLSQVILLLLMAFH